MKTTYVHNKKTEHGQAGYFLTEMRASNGRLLLAEGRTENESRFGMRILLDNLFRRETSTTKAA